MARQVLPGAIDQGGPGDGGEMVAQRRFGHEAELVGEPWSDGQAMLEPDQPEEVRGGEGNFAVQQVHAEQADVGQGLQPGRFDPSDQPARHPIEEAIAGPAGGTLHDRGSIDAQRGRAIAQDIHFEDEGFLEYCQCRCIVPLLVCQYRLHQIQGIRHVSGRSVAEGEWDRRGTPRGRLGIEQA